MKRLYSARDYLQAHDLRLFLEARGITVGLDGDNSSLESGIYFSDLSRPGVYVSDSDWAYGEELLREYLATLEPTPDGREWNCERCGESVPWQFDECWKCATPKSDDAQPFSRYANDIEGFPTTETNEPSPGRLDQLDALPKLDVRGRRDAWIEIAALLSIVWLPYFYSAIETWLYPELSGQRPFAIDAMATIVSSLSVSIIVLFVMFRSNLPWRAYGIMRPRLFMDTSLGVLIWVAAIIADLTVLAVAGRFFGYWAVFDFTTSTFDFVPARSALDQVLLVPMCLAIGFSEEIAMRGYLIPRLEQLLGSAWTAVAVSSALFASYHIYQGFGSVLVIFTTGLVLGAAFVITRRLWPVVVAHTIIDIVAG